MPGKTTTKVDWNKVARLLLRSIPLVAGPEIYDLVLDFRKSHEDLDQKVTKAADALSQASALVAELQSELEKRVESVRKLQEQHRKYEQLASIEEEKARVLIAQMEEALGVGRARERWIALGINILAGLIVFVLGVWLSPWIKGLMGL